MRGMTERIEYPLGVGLREAAKGKPENASQVDGA